MTHMIAALALACAFAAVMAVASAAIVLRLDCMIGNQSACAQVHAIIYDAPKSSPPNPPSNPLAQ